MPVHAFMPAPKACSVPKRRSPNAELLDLQQRPWSRSSRGLDAQHDAIVRSDAETSQTKYALSWLAAATLQPRAAGQRSLDTLLNKPHPVAGRQLYDSPQARPGCKPDDVRRALRSRQPSRCEMLPKPSARSMTPCGACSQSTSRCEMFPKKPSARDSPKQRRRTDVDRSWAET